MSFRRAWKVCGWCTIQSGRVLLIGVWLLLLTALAGQIHLLSSRRVPVPDPLREYARRQLALHGVRLDYGRALMDFSGHVVFENIRAGLLKSPDAPLATARTVYARFDPWALLVGQLKIEEIRVSGLNLHLPAADSPSGIDEVPLGNIDFGLHPLDHALELSYFTGYAGRLPVQLSGRIAFDSSSRSGSSPADIVTESVAAWIKLARNAPVADAWLAAFDSPRVNIRLEAGTAALHFQADALRLDALPKLDTQGRLTGLHADVTLPLRALLTEPLTLTGAAQSLSLPHGISADALLFRVHAGGGFDPRNVELQFGSLRGPVTEDALPVEIGPLAASITRSFDNTLAADLSLTVAGAPWRLQASGLPSRDGFGRLQLDGFVDNDTLAFAGGLIDRDLTELLDPAQPAPLHAVADFGPGWKLNRATGRLHSGFVLVGGVPLDETGTEFTYDGSRVVADNLVLRLGDSLAHGSYEMDTHTMDFRFLLTGGLRPALISPWFHAWWTNFWKTFDFSRGLPVADVDVRGRWGDLTATQVFVQADAPGTALSGVPFDRVRTRLFLRPHWFDIQHFAVASGGSTAEGWLSRSLDLKKDTWRSMEFAVDSTLPLETISKLFPAESAELLAPYSFSTPPRLNLSGRVDSADSLAGKHEKIDITLNSAGAMTYHGFPLADLGFQANLRDDRIDLPTLGVTFAGGRATGNARLTGAENARRLSFDIQLAKANLGAVALAVAKLQPSAAVTGAPPAPAAVTTAPAEPLSPKAVEAARLRQERLDRGSLDFSLAAEGLYSNFYTFKGTGNASITGTELAQLNLFGPLSEALHGTFLNLGSFSLTTVSAPFTLDGERVHFDKLRVTGPSALLQADGDYLLRDGRLAFTAKVHPFDASPSLVGTAVDFVLTPFSKVFEVKLQGTLAKPSWIFAYGPSRLLNTLTGGEKNTPAETPAPEAKP